MGKEDKQSGFTLVETAIIVALIGILSAIAIPNFMSWLPNMRLRAEARDLYSNMQKTRMEAIKSNQSWAIVFAPASNSYSICSSPGADGDWTTLVDNTVVQTHTLSPSDGIGYGIGNIVGNNSMIQGQPIPADGLDYAPPVLVLNPRGVSAVEGYVYLQNRDNSVFAVGTQISGRILLRRWMGGNWQ